MDERCLVSASDTPSAYAARTLSSDDALAFEDHLIECAACQTAVRDAAALSTALRREDSLFRTRAGIGAAAVAVLAIGVALAWPTDPVRRLGAIGPAPGFEGLAVRTDPDSLAAIEDQGMTAYSTGDFEEAARLLGSVASDDTRPGIHFYLGISLLQEGRAREALDALERSLHPPGNPYEDEGRFHLAKAHLSLGDAKAALATLADVAPDSPQRTHAVALADSVRGVLR